MARLKSRTQFIPEGFGFTQPILNYETQGALYKSFYVVRDEIVQVRKANPYLSEQNNLSTDPDVVADELDAFCAARCQARGWTNFITEGGPSPPLWGPPQRLRQSGVAAVASVKKTAAGVAVVVDWLGSGLRPVDKALAESRAGRCVECSQNVDPNWIQKLDAIASEGVRKVIEIKNDLKLETQHDDKLFSCALCDCPMRTKIWANHAHIWARTSDAVKKDLAEVRTATGQKCWIISESEANA